MSLVLACHAVEKPSENKTDSTLETNTTSTVIEAQASIIVVQSQVFGPFQLDKVSLRLTEPLPAALIQSCATFASTKAAAMSASVGSNWSWMNSTAPLDEVKAYNAAYGKNCKGSPDTSDSMCVAIAAKAYDQACPDKPLTDLKYSPATIVSAVDGKFPLPKLSAGTYSLTLSIGDPNSLTPTISNFYQQFTIPVQGDLIVPIWTAMP